MDNAPSTAVAAAELQPRQRCFGRFELVRRLESAMPGELWLARDEEQKRDLALRFLPEAQARQPEVMAHLRGAVSRATQLIHPGIVRILGLHEGDGCAAIEQEPFPGLSLARLALERPGKVLEPPVLRPLLAQLCEALDHAHAHGVAHGDLRPAVLLVSSDGRLKVSDWGLTTTVARVSVREEECPRGTPAYLSPQRLAGEQPGIADDIYALGATVHELLVGRPPFHAGNIVAQVRGKTPAPIAVSRAQTSWPVAERSSGETIPPDWDATIAACLAKDPAQRPQNAAEVSARLLLPGDLDGGSVVADPAGRRRTSARMSPLRWLRSRPKPVLLGVLAAAVIVAYGVAKHWPEHPATLAPAGALVVSSSPAGALVQVASRAARRTPVDLRDLPPGRYAVAVRLDGYEDWTAVAEVKGGQTTSLAATLVRPTGRVSIFAPAGAEVLEGGRRVGTVPLVLERVPTGAVRYVLQGGGYEPGEVAGVVVRNAELRLGRDLPPWRGPTRGAAWRIPDLELEMIWIPAVAHGANGEPTDDAAGGFWLGRMEVTQAQWRAIMREDRSLAHGDDRPAENLSWAEAMEFCRQLNERERKAGRLPVGWRYTLPTEAEWKRAALAGGHGFTETIDTDAWYGKNSGGTTHPVGRKQPNAWGFHDMRGNVAEWCRPARTESVTNFRRSAESGFGSYCGGAWCDTADALADLGATSVAADKRRIDIGLRLSLARTELE